MAKTKEFKVKINGKVFRPSYASANQPVVVVGDPSGGYDNPRISFVMVRDDNPEGFDPINVTIQFQRHSLPSDFPAGDRPARGWMDTARRWSECYAGRFDLKIDLDVGRKLDLGTTPRVLEAISVAIGKEIEERNIRHVTSCELDQTVRALEYLGVRLDHRYGAGCSIVYLHEIENRYANGRAEQESKRAERIARDSAGGVS